MADIWSKTTPWFGPDKQTEKVWPRFLCRNPSCKNVGQSHPGCQCGAPSFAKQSKNLEYDASGGAVGRFCDIDQPHQESCPHYASGGEVEENRRFAHDPASAVDLAIAHHGLHHLLTKSGHSQSPDPHRPAHDHMDAHRAGSRAVHSAGHALFDGKNHHESKPEEESHRSGALALGKHLDSIRENPMSALDVGGTLGQALPNHAAMIGAKQAAASNYFNSIRPQPISGESPLDTPMPPDKATQAAYERQLGIANDPLSVMRHTKAGTLLPDDIRTLRAVHPRLADGMAAKATEGLIDSKTRGDTLSDRHRQGLSELLGQPLDSLDSQPYLAAIQRANGVPMGAQQSQGPSHLAGKKSGATAQTQKTIEKVDSLYETPIEARLAGRRS
jgi:hypothetical protein